MLYVVVLAGRLPIIFVSYQWKRRNSVPEMWMLVSTAFGRRS